MRNWLKSGSPWIWLTAGVVSLSLVAVLGLLLLIGWKGLSYFWPAPVYQFDVELNGHRQVIIGEIYEQKSVPVRQLAEAGVDVSAIEGERVARYLIKTGNRERVALDFVSLLETQVISRRLAQDVAVIDRVKNGKFYGYPVSFVDNGVNKALTALPQGLAEADQVRKEINRLQQDDITAINRQLDQLRRQQRRSGQQPELEQQRQRLDREFTQIEQRLLSLRHLLEQDALLVRDMTGETVALPLEQVLDIWYPNEMTLADKLLHWGRQVAKFVSDDPREANTEGGVFPAIFGTVLMVLLMSVIVTPLGVMAAVYLHEYAGKNRFTNLIRVAVINLAGVPSISLWGIWPRLFRLYGGRHY